MFNLATVIKLEFKWKYFLVIPQYVSEKYLYFVQKYSVVQNILKFEMSRIIRFYGGKIVENLENLKIFPFYLIHINKA